MERVESIAPWQLAYSLVRALGFLAASETRPSAKGEQEVAS